MRPSFGSRPDSYASRHRSLRSLRESAAINPAGTYSGVPTGYPVGMHQTDGTTPGIAAADERDAADAARSPMCVRNDAVGTDHLIADRLLERRRRSRTAGSGTD